VAYEVFSVSAPPTTDPRAAPRGASAVKVAKASNRDFPGGNESARMPNVINVNYVDWLERRGKRTEAGIVTSSVDIWHEREFTQH
jgi:hypothetical protein